MDQILTIITVCLNSEALIEKTIRSVTSQDYPQIEYIIIDGGSIDGTFEILQNYQSKITILISEKDNGIYDAMNKGLAHATGDLVYFLNSGDYLADDDVISEVIRSIEQFPDYGIYTGDVMYYDETGAERWSGERKTTTDVMARVINHQSIIARREVFGNYGGFDTRYRIYADYDWLLRAVLRHGIRIHYTGILFAYYLKAGKSDRVWKKYLPERRESLRKYATPGRMVKYILFYPGDGLRYVVNRLRGMFITES
jgi:glycosyltransferase involved in cell wall biosynthesis